MRSALPVIRSLWLGVLAVAFPLSLTTDGRVLAEVEPTGFYIDEEAPSDLGPPVYEEPGAVYEERSWLISPERTPAWTIDYRFRSLCKSSTSYEFGTSPQIVPGWTPLSRLTFGINSNWHGLQVGIERPTWGVHCEWLMPQQGINGRLDDFDWQMPETPFTDWGIASERWTEGQMLDLGMEFQLLDHVAGIPIEVWPTGGFRWQRLNITAYGLEQLKDDDVWQNPPEYDPRDVIAFNQQYYVTYVGGQLRSELRFKRLPPLLLTFQGDWGYTNGYNVDHHLIRSGDRYTTEGTRGGCWHVALTAESLVTKHTSIGFQVDHAEIRTHGWHHLQNLPRNEDMMWDNGVSVSSDQTALTVFLRVRI